MRVSLSAMRSVRHRCHLSGEHVLKPEVAQVAYPLREEYAIEMVDFVLHDACVEALDRAVEGAARGIERLVAQPAVARDEPTEPRNRKTPFPALLLLLIEHRELRIHQHRVGHRAQLRV